MKIKVGGKAILICGAMAIADLVVVKFDLVNYLKPSVETAAFVPRIKSLEGNHQIAAQSGAVSASVAVELAPVGPTVIAVNDAVSLAVIKPGDESAARVQMAFGKATDPIEFESGKVALTPKALAQLKELLGSLSVLGRSAGVVSVQFNGYTDNVGSAGSNQLLSQRRADAVRNWIVSNTGSTVPEARMQASGYGGAQPVVENTTAAGRAQNRRVEIILLPLARKITTPTAPAQTAG